MLFVLCYRDILWLTNKKGSKFMKRKSIHPLMVLVAVALIAAACSDGKPVGKEQRSPSVGRGLGTGDLEIIPVFDKDDSVLFVSTVDGNTLPGLGKWDYASLFYDGYSVVEDDSGIFFMNKKGKLLNKNNPYCDVTPFSDGVAWVVEDGGWPKAIDKKGNVLFEMKDAHTVYPFYGGYALFIQDLPVYCEETVYGVVDKKGNQKFINESITDGLFPVIVDNRALLATFDTFGWELFECQKDTVHSTMGWGYDYDSGDEIPVCFDQYVDEKYQILNNYIQVLKDRRMPICIKGKWGVTYLSGNFDDKDKKLIDCEYNRIILDGKNYLVKYGRKFGWLDEKGDYLINPRFLDAMPFGESSLAAVKDDVSEKWGFVDKDGNWIITPKFRAVLPFEMRNVAPACDAERRLWGLIDNSGEWIVPPQFEKIYEMGIPDRFMVEDAAEMVGVIDLQGKYIVQPRYDDFETPSILENNYYGYIDEDFSYVRSRYVDVDEIASGLRTYLDTLKSAGLSDLIDNYYGENLRANTSGVVKLDEIRLTKEASVALSIEIDEDFWRKESDGWFGYNYVLDKNIVINEYSLTVTLSDIAKGRAFDVMKKIRSLANSSSDDVLTLDGRKITVAKISPDEILLSITCNL